jgi:hypothetical protein
MLRWMIVMEEDNRKGILQGLDGFGVPMVPVTYRPKGAGSLKPNKAQRGGAKANAKAGAFQGGIGGNLTSREYRLLGGPPLAPRGQFSRVITNFKTTYTDPRQGGKEWAVVGAWDDVVNKNGVHFLPFHFNGTGRLPRRDLRGIRPAGMAKAMDALRNWVRLAIREHFT